MAITDAIIRMVKYPPELLPDSWFGGVALAGEVTPPILDLRRFTPYIAALTNIRVTPNAGVRMRARYDTANLSENTAAMIQDGAGGVGLPGAWHMPAREFLRYNLFGDPGAPVANYPTHFGVWAYPPTIADKLLYDIKLTATELAICDQLGIRNTVEKGLLPLPISQIIEREYQVVGEETHSRSVNIAVAATNYTIEILYPRVNEFLVLTRVAAAPGTAAQDVRFNIDRDDDDNLAQLQTFAMTLNDGGEIKCFIPALSEIRLTATSTVAPGAHLFRFTFQRIRITNILRVRFGQVSRDEVPQDLWDKVKAGVV